MFQKIKTNFQFYNLYPPAPSLKEVCSVLHDTAYCMCLNANEVSDISFDFAYVDFNDINFTVRRLLESGVSPDSTNEDGLTALHQVNNFFYLFFMTYLI